MRKKLGCAFALAVLVISSLKVGDGEYRFRGALGESSSRTLQQVSGTVTQSNKTLPLKTDTRLITIDVVATNTHGVVVSDLRPDEFELSDNGRQKIERFEFVDRSSNKENSRPLGGEQATSTKLFSNGEWLHTLSVPPTVVLIDSLNTNLGDLLKTRAHMLRLLQTLPQNTPVAVLLLNESLVVLQNFSSDPALLRAAVDRAMSPSPESDARTEGDSGSASARNIQPRTDPQGQLPKTLEEMAQTIKDFQRETSAESTDARVTATLAALRTIGNYLAAYRGRKSLIWVSSSFPVVLWPHEEATDVTSVFEGIRDYSEQMRETASVLSNGQVAVYPVDARGLDPGQVFSAQKSGSAGRRGAGGLSSQVNRDEVARLESQSAMETLAHATGGSTCKNTNDLQGCLKVALDNSSAYYELGYYPDRTRWDGSLHRISLKTTRHGVILQYRRGYFAEDTEALLKKVSPEKLLEQACRDLLPATAIPVTMQVTQADAQDGEEYIVFVPADSLSFEPAGESYDLRAEAATCTYGGSDSFRFRTVDLSQNLTSASLSKMQAEGLSWRLGPVPAGTVRLRVAILDLNTALTGAIDFSLPRQDLAPAIAERSRVSPSARSLPAGDKSQPDRDTKVDFRTGSGQSGSLDWSGAVLTYSGSLGPDRAARAFFSRFVVPGFHCQSGELLGDRPSGVSDPMLQMTFTNSGQQTSTVDLRGEHPIYSGTMPVDSNARAFFEGLWYFCHCQVPPVPPQSQN